MGGQKTKIIFFYMDILIYTFNKHIEEEKNMKHQNHKKRLQTFHTTP